MTNTASAHTLLTARRFVNIALDYIDDAAIVLDEAGETELCREVLFIYERLMELQKAIPRAQAR